MEAVTATMSKEGRTDVIKGPMIIAGDRGRDGVRLGYGAAMERTAEREACRRTGWRVRNNRRGTCVGGADQ